MKKILFLLVAIPLSAESMERTGQGHRLPQRRNAQQPQLSPLPEEAPARFDGQDPEQRQLSPRDTLDLKYAVDALQLAEGGRSQSPVNEQPEDGDNASKKVSMSLIRDAIGDLCRKAQAKRADYYVLLSTEGEPLEVLVVVQPVGGPLGFKYVSKPGSSNGQNEEDQDCCKEVAAACDRMATIVGYLTMWFGGVVAADYVMEQIQKNHAKIE